MAEGPQSPDEVPSAKDDGAPARGQGEMRLRIVEGAPSLRTANENPVPAGDFQAALISALGLLAPSQIESLRAAAGASGDIAALMLRQRLVTAQTLAAIGLQAFEREGSEGEFSLIDPEILAGCDLAGANRLRFLPLARARDVLHIAVGEPLNAMRIAEIRASLPEGLKLAPELWPQAEIHDAFELAFAGRFKLDAALQEVTGPALVEAAGDQGQAGERPRRLPPVRPPFENRSRLGVRQAILERPRRSWSEEGIRVFNAIVAEAATRRASALYFEAQGSAVHLRWRIDGAMRAWRMVSDRQFRALLDALETLGAHQQPVRVRLGAFCFSAELLRGDGRFGTIAFKPLRHVPQRLSAQSLASTNWRELRRLLAHPRGLILIAAPPGHGKTWTLGDLACTSHAQQRLAGLVCASEELDLPDVALHEAQSDGDMAEAIRDLVAERADLVLVDAPAGPRAWSAAIDAAAAGLLVFATIAAGDAASAIARVVAAGIAPQDLALVLQGVHAQVLVPALCEKCRANESEGGAQMRALRLASGRELKLYDAGGCDACAHTGRNGFVVVREILTANAALAALIAARAPKAELMECARRNGTVSLAAGGLSRVLQGEITLRDLVRLVDLSAEAEI